MASTYYNLYLDLRRRFRLEGVFDPDRAARELMCAACGKTHEELVRDGRLYAPPEAERALEELARRHLAGEPVAYLVGEWEFYGIGLDISRAVLIPRPDTEVLAARAIEAALAFAEPRVLDLCAGSGCIGLAIAKHVQNARVLLGELDEEALKVCRQNIRRNELSARVSAVRVDAREKPERRLGEFDVIVSNPPYIPTGDIETLDVSVREHEPRLALDGGEDGLDFYRSICSLWREMLRPCGKLLFEVGIGQADPVLRLMRSNGFGDIQVIKDLNDIPRVVCGTVWDEI
ncbi:MAG: peptide chain release factor N(5)-glutamine methyltransferase [Oscillospiraceae bacterium]|nr:peptide chain release factor N(5)-glutamine methyltransferase [Oscillospiraceae bacterium]